MNRGIWFQRARVILPGVLAGLIIGCAEHRAAPPAARSAPNLSGFSPEFKAGYADGCASVSALKRDQSRYDADGPYARGWRDGYSSCKR